MTSPSNPRAVVIGRERLRAGGRVGVVGPGNMGGVSDSVHTAVVELTIPAHQRFLAAARLVASTLASDLDFTVDDIDELRIAVDEALNVLMAVQPDRVPITLTFTMEAGDGGPGRLRIDGTAAGPSPAGPEARPVADGLVQRILRAVTDSFEFETSRFTLTKSSTHDP